MSSVVLLFGWSGTNRWITINSYQAPSKQAGIFMHSERRQIIPADVIGDIYHVHTAISRNLTWTRLHCTTHLAPVMLSLTAEPTALEHWKCSVITQQLPD